MPLSRATGVVAKMSGDAPTGGDDIQDIALGFSDGKAIWLWATLNTAQDTTLAGLVLGEGISDGTTHFSITGAIQDALAVSNANRYHSTAALVITNDAGVVVASCTASFSGSNLRLTWTQNNTGLYLIHYLVLGGTDLTNAKVINTFTAKTTTGTIDRVGFGFAPDFIYGLTQQSPDAIPGSATSVMNMHWAAANKASRKALCWGIYSEDALAIVESQTTIETNLRAWFLKAGVLTNNGSWETSAWIADGFTENWILAAGAPWRYGVMALKGLNYDLHLDLCPTVTGDDTQTGFGFEPMAMLHMMTNVPSGFNANDLSLGFGAVTSTTDEHAVWVGDKDAALDSEVDQRSTALYHLLRMTPGTPTLDVQASFDSFNGDGFKQHLITAPGTAAFQGWVAFAGALPPLPGVVFPARHFIKREIIGY